MAKSITQKAILEKITEFYLSSSDFNGLPLVQLQLDFKLDENQLQKALTSLIRRSKISLNFGENHPNPHIKALPEQPKERQIEMLQGKKRELTHVCAYPSRSHLRRVVEPSRYEGKPFRLRLALGEPQLKYQTFDLSVLEFYRNDPRYYYWNDDISGSISIHDKFLSSMPNADAVLLQTFGFAYDNALNRAVAVFFRYLKNLTPEHQQIWRAKALKGKYKLHPDYFRSSILGQWYEGISVFDALIEEIHHVNQMCKLMGRPPLFRKEFGEGEKPRGFCFLIRPTVKEFNEFIHLLDKILSDNINKDFFLKDVAFESEHLRKDGKIEVRPKGTIQLLAEWLAKKFKTIDRKPLEEMLSTFKQVRRMRQKPAHTIDEDNFHQKYFKKQRDIITKAYAAVRLLRLMLTNHPKVRGYKVPDSLQTGTIWTY